MKKCLFSRTLGVVLIFSMLFLSLLQLQPWIRENDGHMKGNKASNISVVNSVENNDKSKNSGIELVNERTINSKTYKGPENKKIVRYSNRPEHYFSDGQWKEINTKFKKIVDKELMGVMDENNYKVEVMKNYPGIKIKRDSYSILYEPLNTITDSKVKIKDNTVTYNDLWKKSDLVYSVKNNMLKMFIKLNDAKAPKEYNFKIKTEGLKAVLGKDGSVSFINLYGKKSFEIPPMWVKSEHSEEKYFNKIHTELSTTREGYNLKILLDDTELQYPLLIDPSTISFFSNDVGSNKIYIDTYDMYTTEIEEIAFTNDTLDVSGETDGSMINYPMNVYLVHQDVETSGETIPYGYYGCCSKEPGYDGILATQVGRTDVFQGSYQTANELVLKSEDIKKKFNNKERVSGVAFWVPELKNDYDMYTNVYIIYNPSIVNPPIITSTGYKDGKFVWDYWDKDGRNTQAEYKLVIDNVVDTGGYIKSKNKYYLLPFNLKDNVYNFTLTIVDDTGEIDTRYGKLLVGIDSIPPTKPKNLKIININKNSVTVSWGASIDNVEMSGYSVLVNGIQIERISSNNTNYTVNNLKDGQVNTIIIKANDSSGNTSYAEIKVPIGELEYKYDVRNRLDYIKFKSTGNIYIDYLYDPNGNLVNKIVK